MEDNDLTKLALEEVQKERIIESEKKIEKIKEYLEYGDIESAKKTTIIIDQPEYVFKAMKLIIGNRNNNMIDENTWSTLVNIFVQNKVVTVLDFLCFIKELNYPINSSTTDNQFYGKILTEISTFNDLLKVFEALKNDIVRYIFISNYYNYLEISYLFRGSSNQINEKFILIMMTFNADEYKYKYICDNIDKYEENNVNININFTMNILDSFESNEYKIKFIREHLSSVTLDKLLAIKNESKELKLKKDRK